MQKRTLSADETSLLILIIATLLGGWFRFMPAWLAGFPVNDGGMFYTMMKDLKANHFVPPLYTSYNQLNIPFAYPPLTLYVGAFLSSSFRISELEILHWLPAFINTLTIPIFYLLAKEIIGDKFKSAISTLIFAFTPHLVEWLSMGGGLTRSFGTLFMMLTALFSYRMFKQGHNKYVLYTMLFGSLTALSHTESTIFAIVLPVLIWFFISRTMNGARQGFRVASGVIALAGSWYGFVVYKHGLAPLLSALKTGGQNPFAFLLLFNIRAITTEPFIDLLGVVGFLGLIALLTNKQYFIPALYVFIYLIQPRSAHTIVNIPLAMAAGIFFTDALQLHIKRPIVLIIIVVPLLFANIIYHSYVVSLNHVSDEERIAFQWVEENTPKESRFLVLTGEPIPFCDSTSEWFPALTGRQSITTVQGREWVAGEEIKDFLVHKADTEMCLDEGLECLKREIGYFNEDVDYVYISYQKPVTFCEQLVEFSAEIRVLTTALKNLHELQMEYETSSILIFRWK